MSGRTQIRNRNSEASSSQQTNNSSRVQIGYAYGGDEYDDDYEGSDSDADDLDNEDQFYDCEDVTENDSNV